MNRPRRPPFSPAKKRKPAPNRGPATGHGGPRRRSPLDMVPNTAESRFRVLGTGTDRNALMTFATPMEMLVIHGFSSEIEKAFAGFSGRPDDFWGKNPELLDQARKIDELLAGIVDRKNAPR
jgi:hypothetical protein